MCHQKFVGRQKVRARRGMGCGQAFDREQIGSQTVAHFLLTSYQR